MYQYVVRVELLSSSEEDTRPLYRKLHADMEAIGFFRTIIDQHGNKNQLPHAEYYHVRDSNNSALEIWNEVNTYLIQRSYPAVMLVSKAVDVAFTQRAFQEEPRGLFAMLNIKSE